ncbi:hypothetical protein MKX08_009851 [Trichoderma sp. CBMAI-0020]|nr:hypothetical protein MKX08_009851 [Trichoderma sp. CBMAI-0020]
MRVKIPQPWENRELNNDVVLKIRCIKRGAKNAEDDLALRESTKNNGIVLYGAGRRRSAQTQWGLETG